MTEKDKLIIESLIKTLTKIDYKYDMGIEKIAINAVYNRALKDVEARLSLFLENKEDQDYIENIIKIYGDQK